MGYLNQFPNTHYYDEDLGFLIKAYKEQENKIEVLEKIYNILQETTIKTTKEQLQAWLEDGTLEIIIASLLKEQFTISTTVEMIDTTSLSIGNVVRTLGYSVVGDCGGATFIIVDSSDLYSIDLSNGLKAQIIIEPHMNALQFGIVGNETDITNKLQKAIEVVHEIGDNYLYIPSGTYIVNGVDTSIEPSEGTHLLDSGGIKLYSGMTIEHSSTTTMKIKPTNYRQYNLYRIYNVKDVTILNGTLYGDRDEHFGENGGEWGYLIAITASENVHIKNVTCRNAWGDGINLQYAYSETSLTKEEKTCKNITIENVICRNNRRQGISIESGENIRVLNCKILDTQGTAPQNGIQIEPANQNSTVNDVLISQCYFNNNHRSVSMYSPYENALITNVTLDKCEFASIYDENNYSITLENNTDFITISNCNINSDGSNGRVCFIGKADYEGHYNCFNNIFHNGQCYFHNNKNQVNFMNNVIESYESTNFLEIYKGGTLTFKNNLWQSAKTNMGVFTGGAVEYLIFTDNIVFFPTTGNYQTFQIDSYPDANIIAVNNFLRGASGKCYFTSYNVKSNHVISQGAYGALYSVGVNPTVNVQRGCMLFDAHRNKPVFFDGSKWIYADGTSV